ncbi:hypothetical protein GEMRC1_005193 [Eukaryota sp. GEM-RC1]
MSHIKDYHPNWKEEVDSSLQRNKMTHFYVKDKASAYFKWLRLVIMNNVPFSFVDSKDLQAFTTVCRTSHGTLVVVGKSLTLHLTKVIAESLGTQFAIVINGWTETVSNTEYLAVIACTV